MFLQVSGILKKGWVAGNRVVKNFNLGFNICVNSEDGCVGVDGELQDLERRIVELQEKILVRLEETRTKLRWLCRCGRRASGS